MYGVTGLQHCSRRTVHLSQQKLQCRSNLQHNTRQCNPGFSQSQDADKGDHLQKTVLLYNLSKKSRTWLYTHR
jgi:hypothetical protein